MLILRKFELFCICFKMRNFSRKHMGGSAFERSNNEFSEKNIFILPHSPLLSATIEDRYIPPKPLRRLNKAKIADISLTFRVRFRTLLTLFIQNFSGKPRTWLIKDFYRGDSWFDALRLRFSIFCVALTHKPSIFCHFGSPKETFWDENFSKNDENLIFSKSVLEHRRGSEMAF